MYQKDTIQCVEILLAYLCLTFLTGSAILILMQSANLIPRTVAQGCKIVIACEHFL